MGKTTHRYGYKKNDKTLLGYVHYKEQRGPIRRMKRPAQQQLNDEGNSDDEERKGGKR
jgi:hypothetical protein